MKTPLLIIALLLTSLVTAQETRLKATVTNGNTPLESAHILNLSQQKQTISDGEGHFEIAAAVTDTLVITFVGYRELSFRVSPELLKREGIELVMTESGIPLEEVTVETNRALDPVALGLLTKRPEKLRANERKLKEAGDFKAVQLLGIVGGGVPIIPMLNKITGRTKRLKKRVAVENENILKEYLQYHYSEFIEKRLGLQSEWIDRFLYYAVINHSWDDIYPDGNKEQFHFRLIQVYQDFNKVLESGAILPEEDPTPSVGG